MTQNSTRAVIWDFDGVIIDTADYHFKAWKSAFDKNGINLTPEQFRMTFGQKNNAIIRSVLGKDVPAETINTIACQKEVIFREIIVNNLKALPGAIELLTSVKKCGFKVALASSAPMFNINLLLKTLNIEPYFPVVISADDVTEGKPNPQVFLLAAQKLGVNPADCVVIEDAIAGVAAAKRAGMYCLAVTTTHPRACLGEADSVVDTLATVSVNDIKRLYK